MKNISEIIDYWRRFLGLQEYTVHTVHIHSDQIMYPDDIEEEDRYFIGVSVNHCIATIYHNRGLTEEDIIHELLHVVYPLKNYQEGEDWINRKTKELLYEKQYRTTKLSNENTYGIRLF